MKFFIICFIGINIVAIFLMKEVAHGFFVEVDTDAPEVSCTPCGKESTESILVTCDSEPRADIYYTKDGTAPSLSTSLYTGPLTIDKTTTLKTIAYDEASNASDVLVCPFVISAMCLPPDTFIDLGPIEFTNKTSAVFEFHGTEDTISFQCQLDGGIWDACESPQSYDNLLDGEHILKVRATNTCGETDPSPAEWQWVVDIVPPTITINTALDQCFSAISPVLDVDFSDDRALANTFYQVDDLGWQMIIGDEIQIAEWDALAEGPHTIYFIAVDGADNATITTEEEALKLRKDTMPPETSIEYNREVCNEYWFSSDVAVSLACTDNGSEGGSGCGCEKTNVAWCQDIMGEGELNCVLTEMDFVIEENGQHLVSYFSEDSAGNIEEIKHSSVIGIDKEEPVVNSFEMSSGNPQNPYLVNMSYPIAAMTWQVADTGGSYLKQVELWSAQDNEGIPGDWQIAQIGEPPQDFIIPLGIGLDFWSILDNPMPYIPPEGIWWYKLRVSDNACHSAESEPIKLTVDRQPPTAVVISPEESVYGDRATWQKPGSFELEVEFTDPGLGFGECQYNIPDIYDLPETLEDLENLDWESTGDCQGKTSETLKQDITVGPGKDCSGFYCIIYVRAEDMAGNENYGYAIYYIDLTPPPEDVPPETSIKCNGGECKTEWYNADDGDIEITLECEDKGVPSPSGCKEKYLNGQLYTGPFNLDEGIHNFEFYSIDNVDNQEEVKTQNIKQDITSPVVGNPGGAPQAWTEQDQTATFTSCEDNLSGCNPDRRAICFYILPTGLMDCIFGTSANISNRAYVFAYTRDFANNEGNSEWIDFLIDATSPDCDIISPDPHSWQGQDFAVELTDSDGLYGCGIDPNECKYRIGNSAQESRTCNSSFIVNVSSAGLCAVEGVDACQVFVSCKDIVGHQSSDEEVFSIDYTPPEVGEILPTTANASVEQNYLAPVSDNIEVAGCGLYVDDVYQGEMELSLSPCSSCIASTPYTFWSEGTYGMFAKCQDLAGNVGSGPSVSVEVTSIPIELTDTTPPMVEVHGAPEDWVSVQQTATLTCEDIGETASGCDPNTFTLIIVLTSGDYVVVFGDEAIISEHAYVYGFAQDYAGNAGISAPTEFKIEEGIGSKIPTVSTLPVYQGDYCAAPMRPSFFWVFEDEGDSQSGYQLQVDDNTNFSSPNIDTGPTLSVSQAYAHNYPDDLAYNTTYYWRVRVWDSQDGFVSEWAQGSSFRTAKHSWPDLHFTWFPQAPSLDQQIQFCAIAQGGCSEIPDDKQSICYNNQNSPISCAGASYAWDFGDLATSSLANPIHIFSQTPSEGFYVVSLLITDQDGYTCPAQEEVNIYLRPPEWEEIPPF